MVNIIYHYCSSSMSFNSTPDDLCAADDRLCSKDVLLLNSQHFISLIEIDEQTLEETDLSFHSLIYAVQCEIKYTS